MQVAANVVPTGGRHELELPGDARAADLVRQLELPTSACLVLRRGSPIPIDEPLSEGDQLEVIYVASGG